jgi:hypothetical protein
LRLGMAYSWSNFHLLRMPRPFKNPTMLVPSVWS